MIEEDKQQHRVVHTEIDLDDLENVRDPPRQTAPPRAIDRRPWGVQSAIRAADHVELPRSRVKEWSAAAQAVARFPDAAREPDASSNLQEEQAA